MAFMAWSDAKFSVNVKLIDDQHKKLLGFVNELHDGMKAGKGGEMAGRLLKSLADYTVEHFDAEEKLMKQHAYPGAGEHQNEHRKLVEQVVDLQKKLAAGKATITMEVMNFLADWLMKHIGVQDKKFAAFLNSKGVV